ncbi:MAG: ribonuclease R [Archangium sp.]
MSSAGRLVGVKELLTVGNLNPGQQTELKRVLRELVKQGRLVRDGKRFGIPGDKPKQKSGPAWQGKPPKQKQDTVPARAPRRSSETGRATKPARENAARRAVREASAPAVQKGPPRTRETRNPTVTGIIHMHRDGFAFLKPIVGQDAEDVFIPPDEARKALDNDQVVVEVVPGRDGRTAGRVLEVKSRTRQVVVGTYFEDNKRAWVEPREVELGDIRVPKTQLARPGDAVKVQLGVGGSMFDGPQALTGEVTGSLGSEADHSVEVLSVAYSKGFNDEFPPEVMAEADQIALEVSEAEAEGEGRHDLRELPLITIDGEDARDFDDAVYAEKHARGTRLVVAIADVSNYVREDMALDAEALRRATSVYLPGRVLPMLPERLSNGICSLKPDVDRLCMVADMVIDSSGHTVEAEVYPGVMRSHARCTYTEVHDVLAGKNVPGRTELKPLFDRLYNLSTTLTKMRIDRGAVDFDLPEQRVELGDDGLPVRLVRRERWESHRLVEECMLAANEAVARFFRERGLPTVNRYHANPDEDRTELFLQLLGAYGVTVPRGDFDSKALNTVLKQLEGHPEQRALNQLALRTMAQAVYSSKNAGHFGLGAEDYLHFTSPIRRYPDLLVHRLLKELWARGKKKPGKGQLEEQQEHLEGLAIQSSERERAAMQVEREVNQLYACLLVKDRIGEEHDATVAGLTENGFYAQLEELWVEGFVKGESVYPDFEFDQSTYRMTFGNGLVVKVGAKCRVMIQSVNMERKQIDFQVVSLEGEEVEAQEPQRRYRSQDTRNQRGGREERGGGKRLSGGRSDRGSRDERGVRDRFGSSRASKPAEERGGRSSERGGFGSRFPKSADDRGARSNERSGGGGFASRFSKKSEDRSGGNRFGASRFSKVKEDDRRSSPPAQSQDRGRFSSRRPEREDVGTTRRFDSAPSRRMEGKGTARSFVKEKPRREQPPPQAWEKKNDAREEEKSEREEAPRQFDARSVLDRLWKERGGGRKR